MPTLSWKDTRLSAIDIPPYDTTVLLTGPGHSIDELISDTAAWCAEKVGEGEIGVQRPSLNLMIYCHGLPGELQICREGLRYAKVGKLAVLKPYFDEVSIHACLVAKGQSGRAFCTRLAHVLDATVAAAVELQGNTGPQVMWGFEDDKKFDGVYYKFLPSGAIKGPFMTI